MAQNNVHTINTGKLIYLLLMANIIIQFLGIVAAIIAYVYKKDAPEWLQSHYQFQIRTFWIGLIMEVLGILLAHVGVGILIIVFWIVWLIMRSVRGMKLLDREQSHPNPQSWLFG